MNMDIADPCSFDGRVIKKYQLGLHTRSQRSPGLMSVLSPSLETLEWVQSRPQDDFTKGNRPVSRASFGQRDVDVLTEGTLESKYQQLHEPPVATGELGGRTGRWAAKRR